MGFVLVNVLFAFLLVIWFFAGFICEIFEELEWVAVFDGASRFEVFCFVFLLLVVLGMVAAVLFIFLVSWNEFFFVYTFIVMGVSCIVSVALVLFFGIFEVFWGDIIVVSIFASLLSILLVVVL